MLKYKIAVLGSGSWGSALAINLARNGAAALLWGRNQKHLSDMRNCNMNTRYLPNIQFPENLNISDCLDDCIKNAEYPIIAVPSHAFAEILSKINKPKHGLAWITKGIDPHSNKLLSELVHAKWGSDFPISIISGPSFAKEVAEGLPTALVIASNNQEYANKLIKILHNDTLRLYASKDINGVQVCGAVKNVIAIACGISDGLKFGANARAALITRGIAEMERLGNVFKAQKETFMGLAGTGDLVLTCTDNQSRNRRFGLKLGEGIDAKTAQQEIGQVVEGCQNAVQIHFLAQKHNIDMPICNEVYAILNNQSSPAQSAQKLMNRPLKSDSGN